MALSHASATYGDGSDSSSRCGSDVGRFWVAMSEKEIPTMICGRLEEHTGAQGIIAYPNWVTEFIFVGDAPLKIYPAVVFMPLGIGRTLRIKTYIYKWNFEPRKVRTQWCRFQVVVR